jgi:hypothetical protein
MVSWYRSWFYTSGTLSGKEYVKHIVAAYAFFFGFFFLGAGLYSIAPVSIGWLAILIWLTLGLLSIGSFIGIFITSSIRFARHLMQR